MEVLMNKKILASLFAVGLAAGCVCSSVDAHGVFFANRLDEKALVLGEGPVDDAYSPEMVKSIIGLDNNGMVIPVQVIKHEKNVVVVPNDKLGITVTDFDYGYWTKDKDGKTVHKPISEVPGAQKVHMPLNMTFTTGMQKQNLSIIKMLSFKSFHLLTH